MKKIPATVITGFLGAGKTTLIRHMMENANGRRIALIINEFGDIGMDRDILKGCGLETCDMEGENGGDVIELANGCICCTVADEFLPTIEALLERPEPPEHIVIETSGLALPKPLVKAFNWPEVRSRVTVDGVVAVIDADAVSAGRFANDEAALQAQREADETLDHDNPLEEVFTDQLNCADMVLLNKADLLDAAALKAVHDDLAAKLRDGVKAIPTSHGAVEPEILLGLDAAAEDDLDARPSHHDGPHDHDHDDFDSFAITLGDIADPEAFEAKILAAVKDHDILRIKGFLHVPGKPMRHVIQGVGARIHRYYDRPWNGSEPKESKLVIIGQHGLDKTAIEAAIRAA